MVKKNVQLVAKAMMTEVLATAILLLVLAFLVLKMEWGEEQIGIGVKMVYGITCFLGGMIVGMSGQTRRYLKGFGCGVLYFLVWWLLSMASGGKTENLSQIWVILGICGIAGMVGGMFSAIFARE